MLLFYSLFYSHLEQNIFGSESRKCRPQTRKNNDNAILANTRTGMTSYYRSTEKVNMVSSWISFYFPLTGTTSALNLATFYRVVPGVVRVAASNCRTLATSLMGSWMFGFVDLLQCFLVFCLQPLVFTMASLVINTPWHCSFNT